MSGRKDRPELRVVDGRNDSVVRRQRFELTHPEAERTVPPRHRLKAFASFGG
jgi:hypothetical protein